MVSIFSSRIAKRLNNRTTEYYHAISTALPALTLGEHWNRIRLTLSLILVIITGSRNVLDPMAVAFFLASARPERLT